MLGTRIILLGANQLPGTTDAPNDAEIICAANHEIPLFWLLPFSSDDLKRFTVNASSEAIIDHQANAEYPVIVATVTDIQERLSARFAILEPYLKDADAQLLQRWVEFIQSIQFQYVALDTYELWCNCEKPSELSVQIESTLKLLEQLQTHKVEETLRSLIEKGLWQENNAIALAGFGW